MRFFAPCLLLALALASPVLAQSAALLPNGKQTFVDGNGQPYSGGQVFFYTPSTTTPKTTWIDPAEATANPNPVLLDSAGRAVIYGAGQYREVLKDQYGNTIWDQLTASVNGNATFATITGNTSGDLVCMANTGTGIRDCGLAISAGQYPGVSAATAASAGNLGQYVEASLPESSAPIMVSNQLYQVAGINLGPGNWDVSGVVAFYGGTSAVTLLEAGINSSLALPTPGLSNYASLGFGTGGAGAAFTGGNVTLPMPPARFSLAATTTLYLVAACFYTSSTCISWGEIRATRVN